MNISRQTLVLKCGDKILKDFSYGQSIPYDYLERITGCDKNDSTFFILLSCIKDYLIEFGYVLKPIMNEGYKILHSNEIPSFVMNKYIGSSLAKLKKGRRILHYVNKNQLNEHEVSIIENLEKFVTELEHDNENKIMAIQYQINEVIVKELNE